MTQRATCTRHYLWALLSPLSSLSVNEAALRALVSIAQGSTTAAAQLAGFAGGKDVALPEGARPGRYCSPRHPRHLGPSFHYSPSSSMFCTLFPLIATSSNTFSTLICCFKWYLVTWRAISDGPYFGAEWFVPMFFSPSDQVAGKAARRGLASVARNVIGCHSAQAIARHVIGYQLNS
jgi:hypothetical protein